MRDDGSKRHLPDGAWRDTLLVTGISLGLYLLLGQDRFYKEDGPLLVLRLQRGELLHYAHFLYLPIVRAFELVLAPLGLGTYRVAVVASAVCTTLGLMATHRAMLRFGIERRDALLAAALVGTSPGIVFFATVVEIHGVFFAFCGLAWYCAARLDQAPGAGRACLLGGSTALAAFVHAFGNLLPACVLPLIFARRKHASLGLIRLLAVAGVVHLAAIVTLPMLARASGIPLPASNWLGQIRLYTGDTLLSELALLPSVVWAEWLVPFLPLSLLWIASINRARLVCGFLVGLGLYVLATWFLVRHAPEQGAYLAPIAVSAALLTVGHGYRRTLLACVVLGLALSVTSVRRHDTPTAGHYAADLQAATEIDKSFYILGTKQDLNPLIAADVSIEFIGISELVSLLADANGDPRAILAAVGAQIDGVLAQGKRVYLTESARNLRHVSEQANAIVAFLEARYQFQEIRHGVFHAWRLSR